jgi:hypothetical protein
MHPNLGDFALGSTVHLMWDSRDTTGASVTRSTNGSIRIYKNDSTTQRSSSAGITDTEDFDGLTGVHHVEIDTGDDTDSGFYTNGDYFVVLEGATIDSVTVNRVLAHFSLGNRNVTPDTVSSAMHSTTLTEAYPADGAAGTLGELLYLILAIVGQSQVGGTTIEALKLDGSTVAATYTTDDASDPTQRIRTG